MKYEIPEAEIIVFGTADIITTSGGITDPGEADIFPTAGAALLN